MSFYFSRVYRRIQKQKEKVNYMKKEFNEYMQKEIKKGNKYEDFNPPPDIKANPFYWGFVIKNHFKESFQNINSKFKNSPKLLNYENKINQSLSKPKEGIGKITEYTKKYAVTIIEKIHQLVTKVTGGYLDVRKITDKYIPQLYHSSVSGLVIIGTKVNYLVKAIYSKSLAFINKHKDKEMNQKFKAHYENMYKNLERRAGDPNRKSYTTRFSAFLIPPSVKLLFGNGLRKMNTFIRSPTYVKKMLSYKLKIKSVWDKRSNFKEYKYSYYFTSFYNKAKGTHVSTYVEKFKYKNVKDYFFGGTKRKIRNLLLYIASIIGGYYIIKSMFRRVKDRSGDKKLKEALTAVKELKHQNENLMKYNIDLMNRLREDNRK